MLRSHADSAATATLPARIVTGRGEVTGSGQASEPKSKSESKGYCAFIYSAFVWRLTDTPIRDSKDGASRPATSESAFVFDFDLPVNTR